MNNQACRKRSERPTPFYVSRNGLRTAKGREAGVPSSPGERTPLLTVNEGALGLREGGGKTSASNNAKESCLSGLEQGEKRGWAGLRRMRRGSEDKKREKLEYTYSRETCLAGQKVRVGRWGCAGGVARGGEKKNVPLNTAWEEKVRWRNTRPNNLATGQKRKRQASTSRIKQGENGKKAVGRREFNPADSPGGGRDTKNQGLRREGALCQERGSG